MTFRTVRTFFGRYMALLLIVALSAGFFAGLKVTTDAMINTGGDYFDEQNFYDFRLFSTLGFSQDDAEEFLSLEGIKEAEGAYSVDALIEHRTATILLRSILSTVRSIFRLSQQADFLKRKMNALQMKMFSRKMISAKKYPCPPKTMNQ